MNNMKKNMVKLENVTKEYGEEGNRQVVLKGLDIGIEKGKMTAIMGKSGSGKSTLLNIMGFLDDRYVGEYYLDGEKVSKFSKKQKSRLRNEKIGFVFQDFNLVNELTAKENVKLVVNFSNLYKKIGNRFSKKKINNMAENMLIKLGLEKHMDKKPGQLSGGQKQRVAIARAIVNNPDLILADEPTGALDKKTGEEIIELMKELKNEGKTIVIVTHDKEVASKCDSQIIVEDGKLVNAYKCIKCE